MSLAQRVRDIRYAKGWGPDELANRAEISRTALYQIESGKTGLPRAGTLRRIAVALEVPMEDLLECEVGSDGAEATDRNGASRRPRGFYDWVPSEGGPLTLPGGGGYKALSVANPEESRFTIEPELSPRTNGHDSVFVREGELMSKLHDLLHSPIGDGVAGVIEELHSMLPRGRGSI
jgi:transcriptional regulator with XRE-family HTH domain